MDDERVFHIGPIRPPSEARSLLIQVTRGCTWNRCRFCNLYRDTQFKAYSADSVKQDIDTIAAYAQEVRGFWSVGHWDLDGLNERLREFRDDGARQCFYMVAQWLIDGGENVFLQDGNTTVLSSGRLSEVLVYLKQVFPQIKRITSYGRAEELSRHSADYFAELKEAGLDRIHSGFETGSDKVLELINKGTTADHEITAGKNIRAGGIELSIYFMPGIGGKALSTENAEGTARVLNEVNPDFLRIRTGAVKPGTELYELYRQGQASLCGNTGPGDGSPVRLEPQTFRLCSDDDNDGPGDGSPVLPNPQAFRLCSDDDKIREIRQVIALADGVGTQVVSDHMVNLLQDINGNLGSVRERRQMLARIDQYLGLPESDRRAFQLLRRTLRAYDLDDMLALPEAQMEQLREAVAGESEERWDEKMNEYISRFI